MKLTQDSYEAREWQWQLYTQAGNERMQVNFYLEAKQAYNQAMELARLLLEEAKNTNHHSEAIHPYVVSGQNLADSWFNLGDVPQAEMVLQQVFNQVKMVMTNKCFPSPLRLEAFKALGAVSCEIDGFYRTQNQIPQAEEALARAITLAEDFLAESNSSKWSLLRTRRKSVTQDSSGFFSLLIRTLKNQAG